MTIEQAFPLALQYHQAGRLAEAENLYRQIIAVAPRHAPARHLLGVIAHQFGRHEAAIGLIQDAIALAPDQADFYSNLGEAFRAQGQLEKAIAAYRHAIALQPRYPQAFCNLGNALWQNGQPEQAIAACRQAIALQPAYPEAYNNLGNALHECGQSDEAIAAFRQAIALRPHYPEAHNNLGNALYDRNQLDEAIAAFRQALALQPNYPEALNNLGGVLRDTGQLDAAIAAYRRSFALKPHDPKAHADFFLAINCHPGFDARAIAGESRLWSRQHAEPLRPFLKPHRNDPAPERRLRIGYVSPDFRDHPVGRFLLPALANHDPQHFEVFAYAHVPRPVAMTERLRTHADVWRNLADLSDAQAAELIAADGIDILVDLAGHTSNHRLLIFARKPAPVQVTWLGYPNTTGLDTIDYRLTDAWADPPVQTELHSSEKLFRLAACAWCFAPGASPPIAERREGPVTFGCFNNFAKVTEPMLDLWGRVLLAAPGSRLLLKARGLGSKITRQRVEQRLENAGIGPERLEILDYEADYGGHLALYERMDIALDTFPYHGTTTTCEALWMGVPVISLAGRDHVSRVGVSLLANTGLPELVAESPADYVRLAAGLAGDLPRLTDLRRTLRDRMKKSPLMDAPRFSHDLEAAYRTMWRDWCRQRE